MTSSRSLPRPVEEKLRETVLRVQNAAAAQRLYERLEPVEQRLLGKLETFWRNHPSVVDGRTVGMWMQLKNVSQPRAVVEVGHGLNFLTDDDRTWLLRELGELPRSVEDASATCDLVLDEAEREVYWRGERVDFPWERGRALWNFVWTLVEFAKSGRGVDHTDFGEVSPRYVSKMISRLRHEVDGFPEELLDLVDVQNGVSKLELPPDRIALFRTDTREFVTEVGSESG